MVRIGQLSALSVKTKLEFALLALAAAGGIVAAHFVSSAAASPVTPSSDNQGVHLSVSHQTSRTSEESSAAAEDSSDSGQPATNSSSSSLSVNGQAVPLPANGTVDKTIDGPGSATTIHAETSTSDTQSGQAASSSSSNVNISVDSNSQEASP